MKKILIAITLMAVVFLPSVVLADTDDLTLKGELPEGDETKIISVINTIGNYLFGALILVALFFIILSAFGFVTSGGDDTKLKGAKNKLLYALVGIIIALLSRGIIALVNNIVNPVNLPPVG